MNTPLPTTLDDVQGPITRARARQLIYQVNSFLGLSVLFENSMMLPNGDDLLVLRNLGIRPVPQELRPVQEGLRPVQEGLRPVLCDLKALRPGVPALRPDLPDLRPGLKRYDQSYDQAYDQ